MSNNSTYSSLVCFFEKLPQCFHWGNSARNMGTRVTGKAVIIHISSKMARDLIAKYQTVYHVWFLKYQRVLPQLRLHLPRHHLHRRSQHRKTVIQYQKTEMLKLRYPKGMEVWMRSFGWNRCMILQKPKAKIKKGIERGRKRYIARIAWLATGIQGEFGWWKYFRRASVRPDAEECRHFQFVSWSFNWAASIRGTGFWWAQCIYALSEGSELWNMLEDQNNKGFLQKTRKRSRAQSGTFSEIWSLQITMFKVKKVNLGTITDMPKWCKT